MRLFRITLAIIATLVLCSPLRAAVTATPVFPQTPKILVTHFIQGTDAAGTYKTVYTGGANGSKILAVYYTTTDGTATHVVTAQLSSSTSDHCATATTCAFLGIDTSETAQATDGSRKGLLDNDFIPRDSDNNTFIFLTGNSQTIEVTFATALTAATKISVTVVAVDF